MTLGLIPQQIRRINPEDKYLIYHKRYIPPIVYKLISYRAVYDYVVHGNGPAFNKRETLGSELVDIEIFDKYPILL